MRVGSTAACNPRQVGTGSETGWARICASLEPNNRHPDWSRHRPLWRGDLRLEGYTDGKSGALHTQPGWQPPHFCFCPYCGAFVVGSLMAPFACRRLAAFNKINNLQWQFYSKFASIITSKPAWLLALRVGRCPWDLFSFLRPTFHPSLERRPCLAGRRNYRLNRPLTPVKSRPQVVMPAHPDMRAIR